MIYSTCRSLTCNTEIAFVKDYGSVLWVFVMKTGKLGFIFSLVINRCKNKNMCISVFLNIWLIRLVKIG